MVLAQERDDDLGWGGGVGVVRSPDLEGVLRKDSQVGWGVML